jgi:predicted component of type VI protein secretion system
MRFVFIMFPLIVASTVSLFGCQMVSNASSSVGTSSSVGQVLSSAQNSVSAPISSAQSAIPSTGVGTAATTASGSLSSAMDVLKSSSNDMAIGSDAPKAPFTIGGALSGFMVAIGLKDSPEEQSLKEQAKAAKAFAASIVPRTIDLIVDSAVDANGDADGHGFSTIFRFYALQDGAAFLKIGSQESDSNSALPYQEELLLPNHIVQIRAKYPSDSQFIAVLFQLHNRPHRWKLLIPVKRLQVDKPLHLVLGRCDVRVKDGLLPLPSVASSTSSKIINKPPVSAIEAALSSVCQ